MHSNFIIKISSSIRTNISVSVSVSNQLLSLGIPRSPTISPTRSMITSSNGSDTPVTSTILTINKLQPGGTILGELSIGTPTHLARDILNNILPQQTLNILGNILSTNDKTLTSINRPLGTEFGHEELEDVLGGSLHHGTDFLEVDPEGLLGSDAG